MAAEFYCYTKTDYQVHKTNGVQTNQPNRASQTMKYNDVMMLLPDAPNAHDPDDTQHGKPNDSGDDASGSP